MAEPRLFFDSDIFVLLSSAGMLDAALEVLGFQRGQVDILPALPTMLRKGKFKQLRDKQLLDRVLADCETVERAESPNIELAERLGACVDIDPGEVVLYGLLVENSPCLLASADKRAMRALNSSPEIRDLRDAVAGRVACLEIVLKSLVVRLGVESVAQAFRDFTGHKSLQIFFSPKNSTDQEACLASLESYIRDLKRTLGDDFLFEP